jgi:putative spermidine/putrescine transport system permease protein
LTDAAIAAARPKAVAPSRSRDRKSALLLAAPAALILIALYAIPLAHLIVGSLVGAEGFSLKAYERILGQPFGRTLIWNSLRLGLITTAITLVVGYPAAFGLALSRGVLRSVFLASLFLPLAVCVIAKAFAWTILLRSHGAVNDLILALHLTDRPIRMIFTQTALIAGAANIFLPFMILPIYAVVAQIDPRLSEAAATLGAPPVAAFVRVVAPLSAPGVVAGVALVFSLSVSAYVIPTLLMGENYPTLATTIAKAFLISRDPALGAAAGAILMAIGLIVVVTGARFAQSSGGAKA